MKKLFKNIFFMLIILGVVSLLLSIFVYPAFNITPWYAGSELIHQKRNRLIENKNIFNTVLIGSSRVFRQIDPAVLDSVTATGIATHSFNFGINWLFAPETFYIYDELLNTEKLKFKFVIIELSKIRSVDYGNLHTTRTFYWYNNELFSLAIRAVWNSNFSLGEKLYLSGVHTLSYIDKLINLGYITNAFNFADTNVNFDVSPDGFQPLSNVENNSSPVFTEENVGARRQKFLNDTSVVTKRKAYSETKFSKFEKHPELLENYNRYYADKMNTLAESALKNGTHLVFLLSPRIDVSQYDELLPLFHHLHPAHRIEISDSRKYPELYLAGNSFDETHLNDRGATLYSTILGNKLNALKAE